MMKKRREFLKLLGKGVFSTVMVSPILQSCGNYNNVIVTENLDSKTLKRLRDFPLRGIEPSNEDIVKLANGLKYKVLIRWNDPINSKESFGFNNDFTCFIPINNNPNDGLLWVNHEYTNPMFVSDYVHGKARTIEQVDKEMQSVGGSIIRVKKVNEQWQFQENDALNKRITAKTKIPLNWDAPIKGVNEVIGTHSNCSGGITPWGTVLTCEENYDQFFGETAYDENDTPSHRKSGLGWEDFYNYPPEHYGWVVEVDPLTAKAKKHIALGRFAHECCTLIELEDKRIVAYTGDDSNNEFIYKFISSKPRSLKEGTLYVADTIHGKWLSLKYEDQPILQEKFKDQTEVLVRAREAAKLVGATPQNRPEDIEIDPLTGAVLIALTNNYSVGDHDGSILKIVEKNNQYESLEFTSETLIAGGAETGFTCPDNMVFDLSGNLWFTSDMSGSKMNQPDGPYSNFKNNGLYVLIRHGEGAGDIIQIASAPVDAEFTGPWFSPDYRTLFLSVQHPGGQSKSMDQPTSTWPHDGDHIPKSGVITIEGDLLDKLNRLKEL